jgi:hypothetical protein
MLAIVALAYYTAVSVLALLGAIWLGQHWWHRKKKRNKGRENLTWPNTRY